MDATLAERSPMAAPGTANLVEASKVQPMQDEPANPGTNAGEAPSTAERLRKHADYQRTYKASRKQFSPSMAYFHAVQLSAGSHRAARVGITAGRVLGNAVERNRIKRRLREAIRANQSLLPAGVDVILHPRRVVLELDYTELRLEIGRIFSKIARSGARMSARTSPEASGKPA